MKSEGQAPIPATTYDYIFVHHHRSSNVGDRMCSPHNFFRFPNPAVRRFRQKLPLGETLIVGGGGVFEEVRRTSEDQNFEKIRRRIVWGIGLPMRGTKDALVREVASLYHSFSTRDYSWRDVFDFVPCVSCLEPAFDSATGNPQHDYVLYLHRIKTVWSAFEKVNAPRLVNENHQLSEVIDFLSSGETVVTNSYHGVYWAQLLGRKVLCLPYGDKFNDMEYRPTFTTSDGWSKDIGIAKRYESPIERYRNLNFEFMDRALALDQ